MPHLRLSLAYIDDVKIHDSSDVANPYRVRQASVVRPPRSDITQRSQQHGLRNRTRFVDGAVFDLSGFVIADSPEDTSDAFDVLEGVLYDYDAEHVFRFLREGRVEEEQSLVRLSAIEAPAEAGFRFVRYAMTLESEDPRIYSHSLRSALYDPTESIGDGGVDMPLVFPLVFSATTSAHLTVTNDGTWDTPPVFRVRGPVVNPVIDNDTTDESIGLIVALGDADLIEVNVYARSVLLNGAERADLFDPTQSSWFELVPGTNLLRLTGTGMTPAVTSLEVLYRDAR